MVPVSIIQCEPSTTTRKYSSNGNELWTRIEDVLVTDHAGVATDGSDNVIAVTNQRAYKYDPLGMLLWTIALLERPMP